MPKLKNKEEIPSSPQNPLFSRGYRPIRDKISKRSRFTMSCYNCSYYYQAVGDKEEVCQNPNVLKYDMVITDTSIYCNQWKPLVDKSKSRWKNDS